MEANTMNDNRYQQPVPEEEKDGPVCMPGAEQVGDGMADLVVLARKGNQDALAALYEKTYNGVFYTIKSMIKDEDTVLDLLQDTYDVTTVNETPGSGRFCL